MPAPRPFLRHAALPLLAVLGLAGSLLAGAFTPALEEDGIRFRLHGHGTFRWKRLVHAYDAALYTHDVPSSSAPLDGGPLRLEIRYHRDFSASDIARGGVALLERNVTPTEFEALRSRVETLNRAYLDVRKGDAYTLTFIPAKGTTLRLNGKPLATLPGDDFAAYFRIWLGPDPISPALRDQLLGKPASP